MAQFAGEQTIVTAACTCDDTMETISLSLGHLTGHCCAPLNRAHSAWRHCPKLKHPPPVPGGGNACSEDDLTARFCSRSLSLSLSLSLYLYGAGRCSCMHGLLHLGVSPPVWDLSSVEMWHPCRRLIRSPCRPVRLSAYNLTHGVLLLLLTQSHWYSQPHHSSVELARYASYKSIAPPLPADAIKLLNAWRHFPLSKSDIIVIIIISVYLSSWHTQLKLQWITLQVHMAVVTKRT